VGQGAVYRVTNVADISKAKDADWLAVKEAHPHPMFNTMAPNAGYDIGVVILAEPTTLKPLRFSTDPSVSMGAKGQNVRLVGYGLNDGFGQTGAGIKRDVTVPVNNVDSLVLDTGSLTAKSCNGDSGGPALLTVNGEEVIVGVTSYGFIFCLGDGYYTRVDLYTDFVKQYVDANP
jgi:hypothetical protein